MFYFGVKRYSTNNLINQFAIFDDIMYIIANKST